MKDKGKTLIMKFGGAAVATADSFVKIACLIEKQRALFPEIVVVVSAMQGMTDHLIELAQKVNPSPPRREYDMLVSAGERISIALLAMALAGKNIEGLSFTGSQSGIITCDKHGDASIVDVRPTRLLQALDEGKVAIVAGFQGVSKNKEITTLGRGGSDTSAVALGIALGASRVEFYKDVPGIFAEDPKKNAAALKYPSLSYTEALEVVEQTGGKVIHPRALKLAQKNSLPLFVRSFHKGEEEGTYIISSSSNKVETTVAAALYE